MSKVIHCLLIFGMILFGTETFAQRIGLLPPSVKWKQIRNDSLRIIYPEGHEEQARRVASLMLKLASVDPITTESRYNPIPVVLQPYTNISNGYVGLAPYVSELYLQANENPFSLGSLNWIDLLAIHEYRHVQQLNAVNQGLSHTVKTLFGELAFTGLYNLAVPNWFREGDAVYAETKWTYQGRGRLSSFTLPFRMKVLHGETWNYYKVRNGSYKEYTPDHYPLGYLMVQYGNYKFGEETWDTILQEAGQFKNLLNPFSGPVQQRTGGRNKHLYQEAMNWYREIWKASNEQEIDYPMISLNSKDLENDYYDMSFPDVNAAGEIYTSITTFDYTTAIYKISPDGKRNKVVSMGLQQDSYFDHSADRFVWTELRFDPRWRRKDKNVIVVYDRKSRHKFSIDAEKGYFSPSLDSDGARIVSLHVDNEGRNSLRILNALSGNILTELPNEDNLYLGYPTWTQDEKGIIATARNAYGEMAIVRQDIVSGKIDFITHYCYAVLGRPVLHEDWIFITTGLDELDQVYALNLDEGIYYQVSDGNKAHYDPAWDPVQKVIVSSEYHLNGKKLVRLPGLPRQWPPYQLHDGIKSCQGNMGTNLLTTTSDNRTFEVKKYSPWSNAINFHSLAVRADDPVWGLEILSDNVLNNVVIAAGYQIDRQDRTNGPYVDLRFGMWYPIFSLGVDNIRGVFEQDGRDFKINANRFNAGVSLPLYFTPGIFQQTFVLSSSYNFVNNRISSLGENFDYKYNHLTHQLTLINSRSMAYRQAVPTWGQRFDLRYSHEITGKPIFQFYVSTDLAFPAFDPSHYLVLHGELLSQDIERGSILLSSSYDGARGFSAVDGKEQYAVGVTYGFPLLYPDRGIGNIFYTRRIRLQPFFDIAYTNDTEAFSSTMKSTGAELIIDFDFPPVSIGVRYSRLLSGYEGNPNVFEIFLPIVRF